MVLKLLYPCLPFSLQPLWTGAGNFHTILNEPWFICMSELETVICINLSLLKSAEIFNHGLTWASFSKLWVILTTVHSRVYATENHCYLEKEVLFLMDMLEEEGEKGITHAPEACIYNCELELALQAILSLKKNLTCGGCICDDSVTHSFVPLGDMVDFAQICPNSCCHFQMTIVKYHMAFIFPHFVRDVKVVSMWAVLGMMQWIINPVLPNHLSESE